MSVPHGSYNPSHILPAGVTDETTYDRAMPQSVDQLYYPLVPVPTPYYNSNNGEIWIYKRGLTYLRPS